MMGRSVHADRDEHARALPGDPIIPNAIAAATHAITIGGPPGDVWPWLVQMGAGRAGWYSYDVLDNARHPSATELLAEFQAIGVGTIMPALPGVTEGFIVLALEPERSLVLGWPAPGGGHLTTWSFVLESAAPNATRLVTRARIAPGYRIFGLPTAISRPVALLVHFIMQRRQLLGIARRVESPAARATTR